MEQRVLSEAIQEQIGDRQVTALLFCTHDLDPEFFEQYVLPVFLGNDFKHNRRTQQAQLDYVIREREIPIDVFYEQSALAAAGTACLGWRKHAMRSPRGYKFHPKVVLALCVDDSGLESLVVSIASANLTASGWWRNVECAEIIRLTAGQRHGYVSGLRQLVQWLSDRRGRWQVAASQAESLRRIQAFLSRSSAYSNSHVSGRLVPQLMPGFDDLSGHLRHLFGSRLDDAHLEIISPFFDGSPGDVVRRLEEWRDAFAPRSFKISLPVRDASSSVSEEIFDAVEATDGVVWARLPRSIVKAATGEEARERSTHAKVYRFWRGNPNPLEVVVIGSHNFTGPALSGEGNWEVSVVVEPDVPHVRAVLEDSTDRPGSFKVLDEDQGDEEDTDVPYIPVTVTYDWRSGVASARWHGRNVSPVTLFRAGREVCRIEWADDRRALLGKSAAASLEKVLRTSALLICRRDDEAEAPLLVEELNYEFKPDLLEGLDLTPAEIFALWSIPDLQTRITQIANIRGAVGYDEDDLELADLPAIGPSMFERFAGVLQAFSSLRTRIDEHVRAKEYQKAGLAVYSERFDAPITALRIMRQQANIDLAHQYVAWGCAQLLDQYVGQAHPGVVEAFSAFRDRLHDELAYSKTIRHQLIESTDDPQMPQFLDWFDLHFSDEVEAV